MKAIVYSTKRNEKEMLMKANADKHELTWQSAALRSETAHYAAGHQAAIVFTNDDVSCSVIAKLADLGVKYIMTRSAGTDHIDFTAATKHDIQIKNVSDYSPYAVAEHAVALVLALSRHLIEAVAKCKLYDFTLTPLTGFNLHGKTVGIVGLGRIGRVAGQIFAGFGCNVLGYDPDLSISCPGIKRVDFDRLLKESDIVSLHVPLNDSTFHMIRTEIIDRMKDSVMLINTARGALVNTNDVLAALDLGKMRYYGADVYEYERGLFFEDHETDQIRDALLNRLLDHQNVLITPHQAFLTIEALADIAAQTIEGLNDWDAHPSLNKMKSSDQAL